MKLCVRFTLKVGYLFILILLLSGCNVWYSLFYTDPVKSYEEAGKHKPYDVIIVPGFPHDSGKVSPILEKRIKWAYYLYKNGYAKNIIFSGSAVHSPYIEAKIMRLFAIQLGIKDENIFIEPKAEHTTENLYYGCKLANELGFEKIAFASDPAQTSFMKPFKRKFKLNVDFLPILYDTVATLKPDIVKIDESGAFVKNFIPLVEREGIMKRLRGTRGHRVKKEIRKARKLSK